MPTSSNNNRRKSIAVAPTGENGPINRGASPSVRFDAKDIAASSKGRKSLPASAIPNKNYSNSNNNNSNSAVTPGKKSSSSSRKSAGEDNPDLVLAYHFKGVSRTPYSMKKRKTPGLKEREHNQHFGDAAAGSGRISQELKRSKTDDSSNSTATNNDNNSNGLNDTFNMGGNTADINSVLYATSSNGGGYDVNESMMSMESKNSTASSTASSEMDALNVTTLSDTHEYTASSFIQATKFRNVLDERAKSLFAEAEAAKRKKKEKEAVEAAAAVEATETLDLQDLTVNGLELTQHPTQSLGGLLSGVKKTPDEPSATLELEDLTLNLGGGDLTQNATQTLGGLLSDLNQKQSVAKSSIQEEEDDDVEIEFSSQQKSRTPRKSEVTVMSKASDDETKSAGNLDDLLAESESFIEEDERQSSFVESTASGNQLNGILEDSPAPAVANSSIAKASPSSLCPSPSFVSGKLTRASPVILKKMGGDMSTIHKLTASLKKEHKQKRMSLPVLAAGNPLRPKMRYSMDPPGVMNETPASPEPATRSDVIDSPARNTRSAKKSPAADSPARNTRSARKSPLSPIPNVDSPARNTRSAVRKSPAADSPARNTRSSRKNNSPSPARSLFNESINNEEKQVPEISEPSEDLSSEYPFLSLGNDPPSNAAARDTLSYSDGEGTQTAVFNEFNDLLQEDSGEIEFTSRQSAKKKKKRRETAETADLAGLLTELASDDEEYAQTTTPKGSAINTPKSILNSSGKKAGKKSVAFGSPKAAEYNVESPSVSMTPMHPKSVRERWAVPDEMDEKTAELEGGMAELLAARGNNDENMYPMDQSYEKTTELESKLDVLLENKEEDSVFSLPSVSVELSRDSSKDDMSMVEPTQTIALEGNLASLAAVNQNGTTAMQSDATETINIENTITSLVGKAGGGETTEDVTLPSLPDATQTIDIEKSMASVLRAGEQHMASESTEPSQTIQLNPDLNDLLDEAGSPHHHSDSIEFSSKHVSGEDDTVSELGMRGMTSHELQNNQEVRQGLERIVESTPPEPVDLTLKEIIAKGGIDLGQLAQPGADVVVNALNIACEASSSSLVNEESEKILSSVVDQIEANEFDVNAEFDAIVEQNEDTMRFIQERLRSAGDPSGMKEMINELAKGVNATIDVEWNTWLLQVAAVYNQELSAILPILENELAAISDKVAMIDKNREQVALPMLIRSARRETKKNLLRTKAEVATCHDEVSELEADLEEAERHLKKLQASQEKFSQLSKSVESAHDLHCKEQDNRQTADSSYFKFFSVEKLHNWVLTGSSDSTLSLVFRGASSQYLTLSFSITDTLVVTLDASMNKVPRSAQSFFSESRKKKFHPAVVGFLSNKMSLLCDDLKKMRLLSPSEIPSVIHFAELRAARIEEAAKEIDTILNRCRDSFLQPSDTLKHEYEFTAFFKNSSRKRDRLRVTLSIADCYPFAPLNLHLQSSSNQFDTDSMNRRLRKIAKPGFGALTRVIDAVHALVR